MNPIEPLEYLWFLFWPTLGLLALWLIPKDNLK